MGRTRLKLTPGLAALVLATALPGTAVPADGGGSLTFEATLAGASFAGMFTSFRADIDFDPASPTTCRFEVRIDTASADTRETERDEALRGPDFFWVERYPVATYEGGGCRVEGEGYAIDGTLELRGVKRAVPLRFTYTAERSGAALEGTANLSRLAFGVGQGEWQDTRWLDDEVTVRFDLLLSPR